MKLKYILAIIILLPSCAQMRYNIAKRHLDKIGLEICDTVTIHDTTVITESHVDTVLKINTTHSDTVIIREGQSEVKYFYNNTDSTIYIEGKCHDTTIVNERTKQTVFKDKSNEPNSLIWLLIGLTTGFLCWVVCKWIENKIKKTLNSR